MKKKLPFLFFIILCLIPIDSSFTFTFNNNLEARFNDSNISVYIASHTCDEINLTPTELVNLTKKAVSLFWNTVNTSSLHLDVKGLLDVNDAFKSEGVCTELGNDGSCTFNQNMLPDGGIIISCNNSAEGNGFTSSILAVSVPNNTNGNEILGSVVLLNDTADTKFNELNEEEQMAVLAHEIGHAFGLGHSTVNDSLMYFATVKKRISLGQDDRDAISYLYPPNSNIANCATVSTNNSNQSITQFFMGAIAMFFIFQLTRMRKFF